MRNITYTPDSVYISCDFRIRWLQDAYFESIKNAPYILFKYPKFRCNLHEHEIEVPIDEWISFSQAVISVFRDNRLLRRELTTNMMEMLFCADEFVNEKFESVFQHDNTITFDDFKTLIDCIVKLDTYAVFNMFLPYKYYFQRLESLSLPPDLWNIDNLMVCMFEPHRILVRKQKLKLAKKYLENTLSEVDICGYQKECAVYEEFEKWIYGVVPLHNSMFCFKNVRNLAASYSLEEIDRELLSLDNSRNKQVKKLYELLCLIKEFASKDEIFDDFIFLSQISTEEEKRHMIECKIFAILGDIFEKLQIKSTRMSLSQLIKTTRYLQKRRELCEN